MKATKAGPIVAKALERFDCSSESIVHSSEQTTINHEPSAINCQGKIMAFVNVSWYDPDVYLRGTGDIQIVKSYPDLAAVNQELGIMNQVFLDNGIFVVPVVYPAVSRDQCRFRASLTAIHSQSDIELVLSVLEKAMMKSEFNFKETKEETNIDKAA